MQKNKVCWQRWDCCQTKTESYIELFSKYHDSYGNRSYVISRDNLKYTIKQNTYSGRKRKATGSVFLKVSPYRDDEGSSQTIYCLCDSIINASPRIGGNGQNRVI